MVQSIAGPLRLFVSCSNAKEDEPLKSQLVTHLETAFLGDIDLWTEARIKPGDDRQREIGEALENADLALLLISPSFLASEFVRNGELAALLDRRERQGLPLFLVLLRACAWTRHPVLGRLQALPRDGKSLAGRSRNIRDRACVDVCHELATVLGQPSSRTVQPEVTAPAKRAMDLLIQKVEENYRSYVIKQYEQLTFKGIAPAGRAISLPLRDVYVELKTVADVPDAADTFSADERRLLLEEQARSRMPRAEMLHQLDSMRLERWRRQARQQSSHLRRRSIHEVLRSPSQSGLVILGDPGSGKTTLLHYLALCAAQEGSLPAASPPSAKEDRLLPIFASLAAYDEYLRRSGSHTSIGEFLPLYYEKWHAKLGLQPLFQQTLEQGRALVLLDGLDEVLESGTRHFVAQGVAAFIKQWTIGGNLFVVTSRVVGYREASLPGNLPHVTVLDFSRTEIELFAHRWCQAYEVWAADDRSDVALKRAAAEEQGLIADIRATPSVELLAVNPLLLTMLALMRRQGGSLPERRIELYAEYVRTLIERRENTRSLGARQQSPDRMATQTTVVYLIELSLWLQQNRPSGTARRLDLEQALAEIYIRHEGLDEAPLLPRIATRARQEAEHFLHEMRHFAGLLAERGRDAFGFLHLTFQEYFAGRALARMDPQARWAVIWPVLHQPRWREPILLCAGQLGNIEHRRDTVSDLARRILQASSEYETLLHRDLLLTADLAAEQVGFSESLLDHIAGRLVALWTSPVRALRRRAMESIARLARGGHQESLRLLLNAIPHRERDEDAFVAAKLAITAASCTELRSRLLSRVQSDDSVDPSVIDALAPLVLDDAEVRQAILKRLNTRSHSEGIAAARALAPTLQTESAVRAGLLKKLEDVSTHCREECIRILAPLLREDAEIRQALLRMVTDEAEHVRERAVEALAPLAGEYSIVRKTLLGKLHDDAEAVRSKAASGLLPLLPRDEEVREKVLEKLRSDGGDPAVIEAIAPYLRADAKHRSMMLATISEWWGRDAFVEVLAPLIEEDAEVRAAILSRLADEFSWVRSAAVRALAPFAATDPEIRNRLANMLEDTSWVIPDAVAALQPLANFRAQSCRALLGRVRDKNPLIRKHAIEAIAPHAEVDGKVREALLDALQDSYHVVRPAAARALAELAGVHSEIRHALVQVLEDPIPQAQQAASKALAALVEKHEDVRLALTNHIAVVGYGLAAAVSALQPLISSFGEIRQAMLGLLSHPDESARHEAVAALGPLAEADEEVRCALIARLDDSEAYVRDEAVEALRHVMLSDRRIQDALRARYDSTGAEDVGRWALIHALGPLAETDLHIRRQLFREIDNIYLTRIAVTELASLVRIDPSIRSLLLGRLDDSPHGNPELIYGLSQLAETDEVVRRTLQARLTKPYELAALSFALRLGPDFVDADPAVRQLILGYMSHQDSGVRGAAAALLAPLTDKREEVVLGFIGLLKDDAYYLRKSAVEALVPVVSRRQDVRVSMTELLDDPDSSVRQATVRALAAALKDDATLRHRLIPWLGEVSEQWDKGHRTRQLLAEAYAPILGSDAKLLDEIAALLRAPSWQAREGAARALLAIPGGPPEELQNALLAMEQDLRGEESLELRLPVAQALINSRDPELSRSAISVLLTALEYGTRPWQLNIGRRVRSQAAAILGELDPLYRDRSVFAALVRVMGGDEDTAVRDAAYEALLRLASAPRTAKSQ